MGDELIALFMLSLRHERGANHPGSLVTPADIDLIRQLLVRHRD